SGRSRRCLGRIVGSDDAAPADLDMAGGVAVVALFHDGAVSHRQRGGAHTRLFRLSPPPIKSGVKLRRGPRLDSHLRGNERKRSASLNLTLPHDAGHAARTVAWRLDGIFQKALGGGGTVARPQIRPGAAMAVGLAGGRARLATRVDRRIERPIVATDPVDRIFGFAERGLDHPGAAHAGHAATRPGARHDLALEPAHGLLARNRWIRKAPRP